MHRFLLLIIGAACALLLPLDVPDNLHVVVSAAEGAVSQKPGAEPYTAAGAATDQPLSAARAAREEKAIQDARRQQLAEKEAALAAKEQELKKLSAKLDAQIRSLDESKKRLDESLKVQSAAQKKLQDEKMQKMVKLFKTLRGEQAGKLIDSIPENQAHILLSRMDTKSVAKLVPFINHPRVLKWVTENLADR